MINVFPEAGSGIGRANRAALLRIQEADKLRCLLFRIFPFYCIILLPILQALFRRMLHFRKKIRLSGKMRA